MLSIIPTDNHSHSSSSYSSQSQSSSYGSNSNSSSNSAKQYMLWADHDNYNITTLVVTDGTNVWRNSASLGYSHRPKSREKDEEATFMNSLICAVTFTKTEADFDYSCEEKAAKPDCLTLKIKQQVSTSSSKLLLEVDLQRDTTPTYKGMTPQLRLLQQISTTMQENLNRSREIVMINTQYEQMINDLLQDLHKFEKFKNRIQDEILEKATILFNIKRREIKDLKEIVAAYEVATLGQNLNIAYPGTDEHRLVAEVAIVAVAAVAVAVVMH
jgi:hypothetical protein